MNFDSTATPRSFVFGSNATMLNVDGRGRCIRGGYQADAISRFPQLLRASRGSADPSMHVLLDLYGVLLDHDKMQRGYRERLADLLTSRYGGDRKEWLRAHEEAYAVYTRSADEADWDARGYGDIVDELDANSLLDMFERVGVAKGPADPLALSRELEREVFLGINA